MFYNMRNILYSSLKKQIYYSMIFLRITYGLELYGSSEKKIQRVQVLQSGLLKVLFNKNERYSTDSLYTQLKLLTVNDLYKKISIVLCE